MILDAGYSPPEQYPSNLRNVDHIHCRHLSRKSWLENVLYVKDSIDMNELAIRCGPSSPDGFNETIIKEAQACVFKPGEVLNFYDGCKHRCIVGSMVLPLSHYEDLEQTVYGQIFPIIVLLAVLANLAVAAVLSQRHMVTPTNVVLRYMAIAELLVGLIPLPWTIFFFTMGYHDRINELQLWWCYLHKYSMDALPPIFHNIAMWLTVLLAGQRYVSISNPLHSRATCNVRNVRYATVVIGAFSVICGLPKSFDYFLGTVEGWIYTGHAEWKYIKACTVSPTPLLQLTGQTVFFNMYFWTRTIGFIILPSVLLVILNVLLIKEIRKAQRRKQRLLRKTQEQVSAILLFMPNMREKRSEEAARQRDSNSTSLMLVAIVSLFLVVNLPQAAFMALLCVCETFNIRLTLLEGMFPAVFLLASNMLVMATYPINFSIYCFMSSSFRQTFKALFIKSIRKESYTRREMNTIITSRRSEYCTQLVNMGTDSEVTIEGSGRTSISRMELHPCSSI